LLSFIFYLRERRGQEHPQEGKRADILRERERERGRETEREGGRKHERDTDLERLSPVLLATYLRT